MYYVYRFLDGLGNVIYVGRTRTSISSRMNQHYGKRGHLPIECYNCVNRIEYIELKSQIDMYIKELYYIDKWKPTYNEVNKYEETAETIIEENEMWIEYKNKKDIYIEKLEGDIHSFKIEIAEKEKIINSQEINVQNYISLKEENKNLERELNMYKDSLIKSDTFSNEKVYSFKDAVSALKEKKHDFFYCDVNANNKETYKLLMYKENEEIFVKNMLTGEKANTNKPSFHASYMMVIMAELLGNFKPYEEIEVEKILTA